MEFSRYMVDNALELLKRDYYKILLVDLSNDEYEPIIVDQKEWDNLPKSDQSISFFFEWFIASDDIHRKDREPFYRFVNLDRLRKLFDKSPKPYHFMYRRIINGDFKWVMMRLVPSSHYSKDHKKIVLYVKDIDRVYTEEYHHILHSL
ncbi:MAG: hypothetical protein MJ170_02955 [Alphaproteobacteria bacterium]|nr:hypothetical protein [Alphaproteobacteria bacterium]